MIITRSTNRISRKQKYRRIDIVGYDTRNNDKRFHFEKKHHRARMVPFFEEKLSSTNWCTQMVNDAPILYREDKASEWKKYIVGRVRKNTLYIHVSIPISKASWRKAKRRYCGPRRLTFSALELRLTIVQPTMQPWYTVRPGSLEILEIIPSRRCCAVVIVLVSGGELRIDRGLWHERPISIPFHAPTSTS